MVLVLEINKSEDLSGVDLAVWELGMEMTVRMILVLGARRFPWPWHSQEPASIKLDESICR